MPTTQCQSSQNCPHALNSGRFHFLYSPYCVRVGVIMFPGLTGLWQISALSSICTHADLQSPYTPGQRFPLLPTSINLLLCACLPSLSSSSSSVFAFICLGALVPTSRGRKSGSRWRADFLRGGAAGRLQMIGGAEP